MLDGGGDFALLQFLVIDFAEPTMLSFFFVAVRARQQMAKLSLYDSSCWHCAVGGEAREEIYLTVEVWKISIITEGRVLYEV